MRATMAGPRCPKSRLHIVIKKASNLRAADFSLTGGKSDPYCTCEIVGRPYGQIKTSVIKKCLDPEWNYEGDLDNCRPGERLQFCVYDYDLVGNDDLLGRTTLEYDQFSEGFEGTIALQETGKKEAFLAIKIDVLSENRPEKDIPRLFVKVEQAKELRGADWGGKSDPYVVVGVPTKQQNKPFRTTVQLGTVDPKWNEEDEIQGFEVGDDIEFVIFDWDRLSSDEELARKMMKSSEFVPNGFNGWLSLGEGGGKLKVSVDLYIPVPPKPADPAEHITPDMRKPAPFLLRCMDTGRQHRLATYTVIGRSKRELDPRYDLVLSSPGIIDVSRQHAVIKCWCGADPSTWRARIYYRVESEDIAERGVGGGPGFGHSGGGTSVDNEPVSLWCGTELLPGNVVRFGIREMWTIERAVIYQKSQVGEVAVARAHRNATEDPGTYRELKVPSGACNQALQQCGDWDSFVRVVLEWCGEPDEPPCVDVIEVLDECGSRAGRYEANSMEAQENFSVRCILREVRMGTTIRLRLSSDPQLLAPILGKLDKDLKMMRSIHAMRGEQLFSGGAG